MAHSRTALSAVAALLLGAVLCTATPQGPCALSLNLFAAPGSAFNCTSDCNYPGGLNKVNQTAAGNTAAYNIMYSAAGIADGNKDFLLYFNPEYFLFTANSTEDVSTCVPAPVTRRRLLAAGDPSYVTAATSATVQYKVNGESFMTAPVVGMAHEIKIPLTSSRFVDGNNTITIQATVNAGSAAINGSSSPATQQVVTSIVTFWRQPGQADADFAFNNMCNTTILTLNATNITPKPQYVLANGSLVAGKVLFTPMITVWGKKVLNLDGTVPSSLYDASTANGMVSFANKYYIMNPAQTNGTLSLVVNDVQLFEGMYEMNVTTSMVSDSSFLVAGLNGLTQILQVDNSNINNKWESSKKPETTIRVGVQRTPTYLSAISSPTTGTLNTGDPITMTWGFKGIGVATCTHDGQAFTPCTSPATINAKDISSGGTKEFVVTFTDVCGNSKVAKFSYSSAGVVAVSKVDMPAIVTPPTGNGAAPSIVSSLATLSMGAAAFAVMSLAL